MSANHVNETVDHVAKALDAAKDDKSQMDALTKLQMDVKQDTKGMSSEEQAAYMKDLNKALEDKKLLPALSVAFAEQVSEGGGLNESDIRSEMRSAGRAQREGDQTKQLDKAMLQYLADNYNKGADLVHANNDGDGGSKISHNDISKKLGEFRAARDEQHRVETDQKSTEKTARALLDCGDQSLFNFIDGKGFKDGTINKDKLEKYLKDARESGSDSGHYSKEKQQLVEQMLKGWDERDSGKWMRGGFSGDGKEKYGMTKDDLIAASGKKSEADLNLKKKVDVTTDAKAGEGYWQIAERTLSKDGKHPSGDEIRNEAKRIGDLNGNKPVKSGDKVKLAEEWKAPEIKAEPKVEPKLEPKTEPKVEPKTEPKTEPKDKDPEVKVVVEVKKGDSYWAIAKRLLGDQASNTEIFERMKELQEKNDNKPLVYNPQHPQTIKI